MENLISSNVIQELVKMAPYGGFAIIIVLIICLTNIRNIKILSNTFDQSIKEVRSAYRESSEDYRQFIEVLMEKLMLMNYTQSNESKNNKNTPKNNKEAS